MLSGLVLNEKGLERGLACGVEMFCMGVSASETHSRKNTGMGTGGARAHHRHGAGRPSRAGKRVQVSVQSAFGCGFEGPVAEGAVLDDRAGATWTRACAASAWPTRPATRIPRRSRTLFGAIRALDPDVELACHFHNTYGLGLANCCAALRAGVTSFESAFGGLGGCPFTKVAGGNVCTEDLVHGCSAWACARTSISTRLIDVARRRRGASSGASCPGCVYRDRPDPASCRAASSAR